MTQGSAFELENRTPRCRCASEFPGVSGVCVLEEEGVDGSSACPLNLPAARSSAEALGTPTTESAPADSSDEAAPPAVANLLGG